MKNKALSSGDSLNLPLPALYEDLAGLILIPSMSLAEKAKRHLRNQALKLSTGPLLCDYCYPSCIASSDSSGIILLISPFLGHSGISFLTSILLSKNLDAPILFFGSAGGIVSNENGISVGSLLEPEQYFIEREDDSLYQVHSNNNASKDKGNNLLSIDKPLSENIEKIRSYHDKCNITLIDMECAYLAKIAQIANVDFRSLILVSDYWNLDDGMHHTGKRADKLEDVDKGLAIIMDFAEQNLSL